MNHKALQRSGVGVAAFLAAVIALLCIARSISYLLFHTLAEFLAIVVSLSMFTLTWTSNRYLSNGYLVVLGGAYGSIGIVDLFHTLTFRGMNLFPEMSTNYPTQFWLIARFLETLALLLAPLLVKRRPRFGVVSSGFGVLALIGCTAVLYQVAPDTFIEGSGLTPFKVYSEYVIIVLLLFGFVLLTRVKNRFETKTYYLLTASLGLAVATEFLFTRYSSFYDFSNELGHYFRFISVALAFIAIVVSGVHHPYELIFRESNEQKLKLIEMNRELSVSESRYRSLYENMEEGVAYCRMYFENGVPSDFVYLEVNGMFGKLTGLHNVVGKKVSDVIPGIRESNPELFKIYGKTALTGQSSRFESYLPALSAWLSVVVYSLEEEHFVAVFSDITEQKRNEELSRNQAFYDVLTELPNRRMLDERLRMAIATSKRTGRYGAVLFLDLDNFKPLNDAHGHQFGDMLLIDVAKRILGCVRAIDTVARLGGDEFVVILGDLDDKKAESESLARSVAEKIRIALAEPYVLSLPDENGSNATVRHRCSSSIGVAMFLGDGEAIEGILRNADEAMYQAKRTGKDRVCSVAVPA